jgi:hypothetical protein
MKSTKKIRSIWLGICVLVLLAIFPVSALAVPELINYQGYLTDAEGNPLNGDVAITFRIWDADVNGTELWSEAHAAVTVTEGVFNVVLGSFVPITAEILDGDRYLGLTVGTDSEMVPRMKVTSGAYAIRAGYAESVAAGSSSEFAPSAHGHSWGEISNIPADFADGVDNTGITVESDPTVPSSVKDGISWDEIAGRPSGLDDGDDVGITVESDPTVPVWLKDGVSWGELSGIPAGFADGTDNTGITDEDDPQVGSNTVNYVPKWNGTALVKGTMYDNGNVGIGTASPQAPLDIAADAYGASLIVEGSTQFNSNIHGGNNDLLSLISTLPGEVNASYITFTTGDGSGQTERMRITPEGNVGIGTTSPQAKLSLQDTGDAPGILLEGTSSMEEGEVWAPIDLRQENEIKGRLYWEGHANGMPDFVIQLSEGQGNTKALTVLGDNGNVGIGTMTPDTKLTIQTPVYGGTALNVGGTSNAKMRVRHIDGKNEESSDTGDLFLQYDVDYNTFLNANSAGSVGIGTTSPASGYKLDVEGKIQATSFDTGDITFRKSGEILWRMFEEDDGLYLENVKTSKVYRLVIQELEKTPISMAQLQLKNQELEKRLARLEALIKKEQYNLSRHFCR